MREEGGGTTLDRWAGVLREALLAVLTEEDVDLGPAEGPDGTPEPGTLEISTDDWTLTIEGLADDVVDGGPFSPLPPPSSSVAAWLAIDDEPDDPAGYPAARRAVMSEAVDRALATADTALDGALRAALISGGDPFSQDLLRALTAAARSTGSEPST